MACTDRKVPIKVLGPAPRQAQERRAVVKRLAWDKHAYGVTTHKPDHGGVRQACNECCAAFLSR